MKKNSINLLAKGALMGAMALVAMPNAAAQEAAQKIAWGELKLFLDPGHSAKENRGLWGYSEAEKTLAVALNIKDMLETYTDIVDGETLQLCRYDEETVVSLEERSDMANAWGADFYYSIHSDASGSVNSVLTLFGGWKENGVEIEKTPNGGKAYGEILNPNLAGVMRVSSRGNWYDRCYYDRSDSHDNHYPYLSVNRRSNMPSLLSEGGYHDMTEQQQRNLNADYKRLEAFAAFQSLLEHLGYERPAQTFMTGMITNSENSQPLNGAKITVGDKQYTTDTFESLFSKYSRNPDLIHNGFYLFEGLEAGKEYPVTVEADGFEPFSTTVTINAGGATSPEYVTFLDVAMTNNMPAKVDAISVDDLDAVNPLNPIIITFSRNMDRESVEQAFSIDNHGEVTLTWINDYTLSVDVSKLEAWWSYTITIDGSIAKNSQTQTLFDGDGDGEPGGNYVLNFCMDEPDTTAPQVVATYPENGSAVVYATRPPIRIEFDEELAFNADKNDACITVKDADGKVYNGTIAHEVIRNRSVLHFYTAEELPRDKAVLVLFEGDVEDLAGNKSEKYSFRFLTEYRPQTFSEMIQPLVDVTGMWTPGGSGSTTGIVNDESTISTLPVGPTADNRTSFGINYVFDEYVDEGTNFLIRDHYPEGMKSEYRTFFDGVLTMWVYGDASNNGVNLFLRAQPDGIKMREEYMPVDFLGWNQFIFDLQNDPVASFTGSVNSFAGQTKWCLDAVAINHAFTDEDDEEVPYQQWTGTIGFNSLEFSRWDEQAERQAQIDDVEDPLQGIISAAIEENAPVEYFNLQGIRVANPENGIYIRRQGNAAQKVVIK